MVDLALVGGSVRTIDSTRPTASAIAVGAGKIVAVGTDAEIRALDTAAETIELHGASVVPGLVDSHIHPILGADDTRGADLTGARTLEAVREALAAERRRNGGNWVLGWGLEYDVFRDTGIRGDLLEDAVGGAPAFVMFMDLHTGVATPQALALAGVDGPRTFDENAEVVCVNDRPTGELRETAACALVQAA